MSHILNIATAVPEFKIEKEELVEFYLKSTSSNEPERFQKKLNFLSAKTKIETRYSCIPDFKGKNNELFINSNYDQPVEKRMGLYKEKIIPLAVNAINTVLIESDINPKDITHLITVTCTGLIAPGLEFLIAEKYNIQNAEKIALNFMGCYAALKALKHAHYIAEANPEACILIVSAELCSLHFHPSTDDEEIIANLLFADGAAAVIMCGEKNKYIQNKTTLKINSLGTAFIPGTADLMTWDISSTAFKMFLSAKVVDAIKDNIYDTITDFLSEDKTETDYWAIHPGGVKIVEAVQKSLSLEDYQVEDSMSILKNYGNMSSPTILFILSRIFDKIKDSNETDSKKIVSCAFGPGLNVEMLSFLSVNKKNDVVEKQVLETHVG